MKKLQSKGVSPFLADFSFMDLIFKDQIYFQKDFVKFSLVPLEGFVNWSEHSKTAFSGYVLDIKQGKMFNEVTPRLNFQTLQNIFRMDVQSALENEDVKHFEAVVNEHGPVLLDEASEVPHVFFASVMRSGNTLSRKLMETVSGVLTGSNYNIIPSVNFALTVQGFKAENHFDSKVWVTKTHFPYVLPFAQPMGASRAVLLVRNPLDIIVSQFMMSATLTHSKSCSNDFVNEFADEWQWLVKS